MKVWSCFLYIQEYFFKLVGSIMKKWKESVQEKGMQSTQFSIQSVKMTFISFKCHRSIDNSNDFIFLSCHEKAHENKEFSCEIQNLIVNHELQPV